MREMKDSGIEWIGEIPREWNIKSAFQIFTQVKCKNENNIESNLLSLSYGKIKRKAIDTVGGLLPERFDGYNIIEKNDVVLRLTDLQNDHKSLRVGLSKERGIITSAYLTLRNKSENTAEYLYYFLHTFDVCKGFYGMGDGVRQGLNWEELKQLKILFPTLPEQQAITNYLDEKCSKIDEITAKIKNTIDEYKKLKQSVITEAVTKGIRPDREMKDSGIEWVGEIPREWVSTIIKRYCNLKTGSTPSTNNQEWFNGSLEWYTPCDFNEQYYLRNSARKLSQKARKDDVVCIVPKNTVMIIGIGGTAGKIGITTTECSFNQQITALINNKKLLSKYLMYWLIANTKILLETALYTTLPIINNETIGEYPLIIPNEILEQQEIADYLDKKCAEIDAVIAKKEQLVTELESYKKSLIYEYVTGKMEVI